MVDGFGDLNGSGNQQAWIHVHLHSQDINGNYSTYYGEVRYYGNGWGTWTATNQNWSADFGGLPVSGAWNIPYERRYDSYTVLWTGYFNHGHNADGTRPAWNASVWIDGNHTSIGDGGTTVTEPASPTIPRASQPSFPGGSGLTTGVAATINTNWASSGFTHNASWSFGNLSGQTTGFSASSGIGGSFTWTPPASMLAQIPNAAVGNGTLYLDTYSGGTYIGGKSVAFTVTAAGSVVPTISSITLADQNATVVSQVGAYLQGLSILRGTVNAAGVQGSTITSRTWSTGGTTVASGSDIVPVGSGTVAIGGAATDSRGRTASYATNITVLPYAVPKFTNVLVRRATSAGVVNDDGTYLRLDLNAEVQSIVNTTQRNTLTIKVFTRLYGTSTWTARNVINHSAVSYNTNVLISGGAIFPVNQSFEVRVEINDKFNMSPAQTIVATAAIFMHWSATGVGIGKYHETGTLDVKGGIYSADGYIPVTISDWNNATKAGFYGSNNTAINAPFAWWWKGMVVQDGGELLQILYGIGYSENQYIRSYSGGAWSSWTNIGSARGTTSMRDTMYGPLTTTAQQVALANRSVRYYNTSLGWEESYYVVSGTSGLTAKGIRSGNANGWYPVSGSALRAFRGMSYGYQGISANSNTDPILAQPTINVGGFTAPFNSSLAPVFGGDYRVSANIYFTGGTSDYCAALLFVDGVQVCSGRAVKANFMDIDVNVNEIIRVSAGQPIAVVAVASHAITVYGANGINGTRLSVEYLGPPLVI